MLKITILQDSPDSWITPWVEQLRASLWNRGHDVIICHDSQSFNAFASRDIAFLLSCERIVPEHLLGRHVHNLVCHPSALPLGKGHSPIAWQILEGSKTIQLTLFEADSRVDSGVIYFTDYIQLEGHELNKEIKYLQGSKTLALCLHFVEAYPDVVGRNQKGEESFYPKRVAADSELDPNQSLRDLFPKLRICDNERYPAFFYLHGHCYQLTINKANSS